VYSGLSSSSSGAMDADCRSLDGAGVLDAAMAAARRGRSTVSCAAGVCVALGVDVIRGGGLDGVEPSSPGIGVAVAT
jgi:hypothetical protein